ncbi:sporulation protein YpjB [Bacillus sp. REN10]|uniref:sporulation protein YpjB n=1 Tax=Bacillus sp. REN10 TaxID=2782541 RepID=UPI00193C5798|nr:sporulation protein YpjB [Bacillus sp. REN10]
MNKFRQLFIIFFLFMLPISTQAEITNSRLLKLDTLSEQALQFTKAGRYDQAEALMEQFNKDYLVLQQDDRLVSAEEWAVIMNVFHEAFALVKQPDGREQKCLEVMTSFRLVVNAISSTSTPLWMQMEEPVMSSLQDVKQSSSQLDSSQFHETFNVFLSNYETLKPSLQVDLDADQLQVLDAQVRYVDHYREEILATPTEADAIERLEKEVKAVFYEKTREESVQPSLGWVISMTGGIIITTLSYVGWRKYKGQQEEARNKPNH